MCIQFDWKGRKKKQQTHCMLVIRAVSFSSQSKKWAREKGIKWHYVFEKQSSHAVFTYQTFAKITQKQEWSFLSISHNYTNFKPSCHKTLKTEPTANLLSNAPNCFPLNISIKESTNHLFPPTPLKNRILNYYQKNPVWESAFLWSEYPHTHMPLRYCQAIMTTCESALSTHLGRGI